MLKVNLKKLKPYGDRLDDGVVQLSFTFPVAASPEAKEAARRYVEKLGLEKVSIATMEPMGGAFTMFVAYGHARDTLDFTKVHVPKIEIPEMSFGELKDSMARHLEEPVVVIGAATGADAHTVGIDAIMNMKGFGGDYGLERYPLFKAVNLRSQLTNAQLIEKAIELKADAILVSQVVTQRDSHIKNLKELRGLARKEKRLPKETILIVGGPRLDHATALKLGFDAGFGQGTKPSQVASFIVREYMKRHGIKEKQVEAKVEVEQKDRPSEPRTKAWHPPRQEPPPHRAPGHHAPKEKPAEGRATHAPRQEHPHRVPAHHAPKHKQVEVKAEVEPKPGAGEGAPLEGVRKRRRRGRRGGRRHRRRGAGGEGAAGPSEAS